jgi:hypothetical protein
MVVVEDDECEPAGISSSRDPIVPRGALEFLFLFSSFFYVFVWRERAIHATCRAGDDVDVCVG